MMMEIRNNINMSMRELAHSLPLRTTLDSRTLPTHRTPKTLNLKLEVPIVALLALPPLPPVPSA
jgi:hypothetical protein